MLIESSMKEVSIVEVLSAGGILRLSDGECYLVLQEDQTLSLRWQPKEVLLVRHTENPVRSFELRSRSRLGECVTAVTG